MELIRYDYPDWAINRDLDRWLKGMFRDLSMGGRGFGHDWSDQDVYLAFDLYESDDAFHAVFELPGMQRKQIDVHIEDQLLTVKGERKEQNGEGESTASFQRSINLPEGVDADQVSAHYKHGMLRVDLPKREDRKPRTIAIK